MVGKYLFPVTMAYFEVGNFEVGNVMTFILFGFYEVFVGLSVMIDGIDLVVIH